jgi:chromosome segregation ATPase
MDKAQLEAKFNELSATQRQAIERRAQLLAQAEELTAQILRLEGRLEQLRELFADPQTS